MTVGKDAIGNFGGAKQILEILRGRFALDAIDSIFQDMAKFTYFKLTGQNFAKLTGISRRQRILRTSNVRARIWRSLHLPGYREVDANFPFLMDFDMLRQKAEARAIMGSGSPDKFVSSLCMQNAALTQNGKTLVPASAGNALAFQSVSAQMRRLSGPCGHASRRDVVVAADMETASDEEDFEAWAVYRKAKRAKKDAQGRGEQGSRGTKKPSAEGRAKNGFNRRTGGRNRCYA